MRISFANIAFQFFKFFWPFPIISISYLEIKTEEKNLTTHKELT